MAWAALTVLEVQECTLFCNDKIRSESVLVAVVFDTCS